MGYLHEAWKDFIRRMGWEDRRYVPAERLLETVDSLAANAAKVAAREIRGLTGA